MAVKELYCHKEWFVLENSQSIQHDRLGPIMGSHTSSLLLPNCQASPSLHTDPDACTYIPLGGKKELLKAVYSIIHMQ